MHEPEDAVRALLTLMERLRDPQAGCPWDLEQTFETIVPFTLEEAYEVADAVDRADPALLRDELGDLLFQIVFLSRMAQERGWFDFSQVAASIHDKLVRRHPHVFAGESVPDARIQTRKWEEIKAQERAEKAAHQESADRSALANVPRALPALARAAKLGRRAARVGFDWRAPHEVRAKVLEELQEVDTAIAEAATASEAVTASEAATASEAVTAGGDRTQTRSDTDLRARIAEELGDLLFAIANWSLHLQIDPEEALRAANGKFERRFRYMESLARQRGVALEALSPEDWDELWRTAKHE